MQHATCNMQHATCNAVSEKPRGNMPACKYASMQACRHAGMQACRHASMQACKHAGMQACRHASMQACNIQTCNMQIAAKLTHVLERYHALCSSVSPEPANAVEVVSVALSACTCVRAR